MGKAKDRIKAMVGFHRDQHNMLTQPVNPPDDVKDVETYRRLAVLQAEYHLKMLFILKGKDPEAIAEED